MIVDDHPDNRAVLRRRFERRGWATVEAENGAEAVAMAVNQRPDAIIMDISMPTMDGVEAVRMIAEFYESPPPAIALTAVSLSELSALCLNAGFCAFFTKPADFASLCAAVDASAPPLAA